jgi:hypothetical protein
MNHAERMAELRRRQSSERVEYPTQTRNQLVKNWAAIESHPRLAFTAIGPDEEAMIRCYFDTGKPFTVVIL